MSDKELTGEIIFGWPDTRWTCFLVVSTLVLVRTRGVKRAAGEFEKLSRMLHIWRHCGTKRAGGW